MSGKRQHYLPACLIGGFGQVVKAKPLRKAKILVRNLATEEVYPSVAEDQAAVDNLYKVTVSMPDGNQNVIDSIWSRLESELPPLVERLGDQKLTSEDNELLVAYVAMVGVRHPSFALVVEDWHKKAGATSILSKDDIQLQRLEAFNKHMEVMPLWR
ncbi:DUF4238 domain-containing protein [Ferrimicrobium sp.]|uniref:DUF4238 domain-containing protein n=1 Tax=Ferrimicrobium sp. TaxID=2926050 RepID=UPI00260BBCE6|nr:DUF4238 domain-containing protein [Ferrimicrobium sp.]